MEHQTPSEERVKYLAGKKAKEQRFIRCTEIRTEITKLEGESRTILKSSPSADVLAAQWKADVEYFVNEFVGELQGRVQTGRSMKIRFDSPAANVYLNADRWLDAIPALAERVAGTNSGRTIASINDELTALRSELSSLGGF